MSKKDTSDNEGSVQKRGGAENPGGKDDLLAHMQKSIDAARKKTTNRREFIKSTGKWSAVIAATFVGVSSLSGCGGGGYGNYGNYSNAGYNAYSNAGYSASGYSKYCNGCRRSYTRYGSTYCNYINYTDGC